MIKRFLLWLLRDEILRDESLRNALLREIRVWGTVRGRLFLEGDLYHLMLNHSYNAGGKNIVEISGSRSSLVRDVLGADSVIYISVQGRDS